MQVIVIETGNSPWSLSGWSLEYIQLDATTYGYKLVDPDGGIHQDSINDGYFMHYHLNSVSEFIKVIAQGRGVGTERAIRKYNLKTQKPETIQL